MKEAKREAEAVIGNVRAEKEAAFQSSSNEVRVGPGARAHGGARTGSRVADAEPGRVLGHEESDGRGDCGDDVCGARVLFPRACRAAHARPGHRKLFEANKATVTDMIVKSVTDVSLELSETRKLAGQRASGQV